MKIRSFNGSEHISSECGGFTEVSRELNKIFKQRGIYSTDEDSIVLVPECLNTQRQFKNQIPYLACEYSHPPHFVTQWLQQYNPTVICISKFARQNLIRGGYPQERVFAALLGHDDNFWKPLDVKKFSDFTFLTINTSNDRSALDVLPIEFLKFAADKPNIRLIIKDRENERYKNWLFSLPNAKEKIIYDGRNLSKEELRELANKSHIHLYYNNCTSYGMVPNNIALCGIPSLVTIGSALVEIVPEWTQTPYLVKTETKPLDCQILYDWSQIGLHAPPLSLYPQGTTREAIITDNIVPSLEYAFSNYEEMLKKNQEHRRFILKNLTWKNTTDKIIEILSK